MEPLAIGVESFARLEFLSNERQASVGAHGAESHDAYVRWFEEQGSFVEAMRKLTACRSVIG